MELARQLAYNYVFRGLPRKVVAGLAALAVERRFRGGDVIVRQFEQSDDLYVILEGSAKIRDFHGDEMTEFGPGSVVGEISLIDEQARSATVVAVGGTLCAVIPASMIRSMMDTDAETKATIMANLSRLLCRRLRSTNQRLTELGNRSVVLR